MAPARQVKSNRIVFTLNNYTEEECQSLLRCINFLEPQIDYCIVGKEVAASGTPHLQGYIKLKTSFLRADRGIISKWRSLFPALKRAHLEPAYGSDLHSEKYCSKDGNLLISVGVPTSDVDSTWTKILQATTMEEICELDPQFAAKNYFQAQAISRNNSLYKTTPRCNLSLKLWQISVLNDLILQNDRQIKFVVDTVGNSGKSYLARFLACHGKPKSVFYCRGGKSADIAHAFSKIADTCEYAVFDYARNKSPEFFSWDLFEELKDGGLTSLKYDGNCFWLPRPIKILVLTNHQLDDHRHRLTSDRWDVTILPEDSLGIPTTRQRPEPVHPNILREFNPALVPDPVPAPPTTPPRQPTYAEVAALEQSIPQDWLDQILRENEINV